MPTTSSTWWSTLWAASPLAVVALLRTPLAQYTPRSRQVTKTGGTVVGIITGTSLQGAPCGAIAAVCCSCLPALCGYKVMSACGLAPKFVGPFMLRANEAKVDLTRLRQWVDQKLLRTEIAEVYSFAEAPKALETLEEGGGHNTQKTKTKAFRGKVVVKVARLKVFGAVVRTLSGFFYDLDPDPDPTSGTHNKWENAWKHFEGLGKRCA
ncbi:unnamed protein product [Durusdinium trenchii]|uniref:Uncharacterized protein n=1 Tax=Durusdinium trenchii TaxID=1381693 RepID=A0ABP0NFQ3_9DINO